MAVEGTLDDYLDAVYDASRVFDHFLDFAIPSELNADSANTYDGSHYRAIVNDRIAAVLSEAGEDYGIEVGQLSEDRYRQTFQAALGQYRSGVPESSRSLDAD